MLCQTVVVVFVMMPIGADLDKDETELTRDFIIIESLDVCRAASSTEFVSF